MPRTGGPFVVVVERISHCAGQRRIGKVTTDRRYDLGADKGVRSRYCGCDGAAVRAIGNIELGCDQLMGQRDEPLPNTS